MPAMPRKPRPHLYHERTRHDTSVWYVRVGKGKRTRIRGVYGSEQFENEYAVAIGKVAPVKQGGTLKWLWNRYKDSKAWNDDLSPATRKQRDAIMRAVLDKGGDKSPAAITGRIIRASMEERSKPQAKSFLKAMRGLFKWALAAELVQSDPTAGIKATSPKTKGFPVWTEDEIAQFEARWPRGTRERVMFDVFLYTGLRIGDAAKLGKQHVRNGVIAIDTDKTGTRVTIPILPELKATLEAGPTGDLHFIASASGKGFRKEVIGEYFRRACREAGVVKSAHGLRKAAATHAVNNGATVAELEAIFGWSGGTMAALYTREADRQRLAAGAMSKLSRVKPETEAPAPLTPVRARGRKSS